MYVLGVTEAVQPVHSVWAGAALRVTRARLARARAALALNTSCAIRLVTTQDGDTVASEHASEHPTGDVECRQVLQAPRAAHAVTITAPRRAALGESIDGFGCAPGERSLRTTGPARALRPGLGT